MYYVGDIHGQGHKSVTTRYGIKLWKNNCGIVTAVWGYWAINPTAQLIAVGLSFQL